MATYGFIPWLRQGIGNKITTPSSGRASVPVEVTYTGEKSNIAATIPKNMQMLGPGDVIGIHPDVIVRMEPANGVFDFESNYLPFIEFYDEDFPWRYSPQANPTDGKLVPWLALIIVKDNEYVILPPEKDDLPGIVQVTGTKSDIFHPTGDHWAWAHVHVHAPNGTGGNYSTNLKNDLLANPDIAVSRLMATRKLETSTQYTAFLIPAFEAGRLVGVGEDPASAAPATISWAGNTLKFPIYAQWRFGTSATGDFETLVKLLKPVTPEPAWGGKKMDITQNGVEYLETLFPSSSLDKTVVMEGALMPPDYASTIGHTNMKDASGMGFSADAFTTSLRDKVLNLADTMRQPGFSALNPFFASAPLGVDPVVLPPMYGQMHANVAKVVQPGSPVWFQNLNLDIRYRAAAGLGVKAVKERQEELMATAWAQIGEVLVANDKIEKAKMAMAASRAIYEKHFLASNFTSAKSTQQKVDAIIKYGSQALKKIQMQDPSQPFSLTAKVSAAKLTSISSMTKATADAGFRKLTRNRSNVVEKMGAALINSDLRINLDNTFSSVTAAKQLSLVAPKAVSTLGQFTQNSSSSASSYSSSSSMTVGGFLSAYQRQKYEMTKTIAFYDYQEQLYQKTRVSLTQNLSTVPYAGPDFVNAVVTKINPNVAITERVKQQIQIQVNGVTSKISSLNTVMAYPVFDEAMYDDLVNISPEYLLPNPEKYPNNSVTLLETNQRFIESYMVGLNHEFARELLWREYPTDQRGSYFRRFWDVKDSITEPEVFDIKFINEWGTSNALGTNYTSKHSGSRIVILIRGDLFKKFPDALVYLQKAKLDNNKRILESDQTQTNLRFPIFKANLQPDITLLGFAGTSTEIKGTVNSASDPGWFVVFRERPGQIRFGMDEPIVGTNYDNAPTSWNNLNWGHMDSPITTVKISAFDINLPPNLAISAPPNPSTPSTVTWGANSAAMATILYQRPAMIAIHADDMIQ